MATLPVIINAEGVVVNLLAQVRPALCEVCSAPEIAAKIPAFEARKLSVRDRRQVIDHAKKCLPCRHALGWGDL